MDDDISDTELAPPDDDRGVKRDRPESFGDGDSERMRRGPASGEYGEDTADASTVTYDSDDENERDQAWWQQVFLARSPPDPYGEPTYDDQESTYAGSPKGGTVEEDQQLVSSGSPKGGSGGDTVNPLDENHIPLMFDHITANACSPDGVSRRLEPNEWLTVYFNTAGVRQTSVIERDLPTLSKEDLEDVCSRGGRSSKTGTGKMDSNEVFFPDVEARCAQSH